MVMRGPLGDKAVKVLLNLLYLLISQFFIRLVYPYS